MTVIADFAYGDYFETRDGLRWIKRHDNFSQYIGKDGEAIESMTISKLYPMNPQTPAVKWERGKTRKKASTLFE